METQQSGLTAERLIRIEEVKRLTGLSAASLYRKISTGDFPSPVRLSASARAWPLSEVQSWIAKRIALRGEGDPGLQPLSLRDAKAQTDGVNAAYQRGGNG